MKGYKTKTEKQLESSLRRILYLVQRVDNFYKRHPNYAFQTELEERATFTVYDVGDIARAALASALISERKQKPRRFVGQVHQFFVERPLQQVAPAPAPINVPDINRMRPEGYIGIALQQLQALGPLQLEVARPNDDNA